MIQSQYEKIAVELLRLVQSGLTFAVCKCIEVVDQKIWTFS